MPPKRKRPDELAAAQPDAQPGPPLSLTRRATRQTPVHPPPVPASVLLSPPLASASASASASAAAAAAALPSAHKTITAVPLPSFPPEQQKRVRGRLAAANKPLPLPLPMTTATGQGVILPLPPLSPGTIRVAAPLPSRRGAAVAAKDMASIAVKENIRPPDLVAPEITYHVPQANHHGRQSSLVRPHGPSAPPPTLDKISPPLPLVVTPVPPPKPPTLPASERAPLRADRNIDKVVLGNLCFRTWYPSYYGKEVLGDTSGNAKGGSKDGAKDTTGGKAQSKKDKDHQPMLERLYVCPSCFKYAKELVAWWGHVKLCQQRGYVPGKKVYIHPRGRRTVIVPHDSSKGPGPKKRRGDVAMKYVEEVVQDEGEWSIWEVDGEEDGLFCQNLSLFAKLFLDNKSVFFDVTGFNYFLLVYTPPPVTTTAGASTPQVPQVTGFFSKEKMSWDNNNLACILVFPPWQRKGLGALLMGASYEISRREGIIGGPEKPISDLGKKGYKRFWSGEIARWLLSLDTGQDGGDNGQETIVDVEDCSQGTWISLEDCLMVLRDMGVVEDAGMGLGKPEKAEEPQPQLPEEEKKKKQGSGVEEESNKHQGGRTGAGAGAGETEEDKQKTKKTTKEVPRVRVDKEAVRRYVAAHRLQLEKTCDPDGFVEGYAMKARDKAQSEDAEAQEEV